MGGVGKVASGVLRELDLPRSAGSRGYDSRGGD